MLWVQFLCSATIIIFAGRTLTVYADLLSERTGLGKLWIGVALLGFVTSLPEAVASLTAVVSLQAYDLAVGNMLGSNLFNPSLLVVMDILYRQGSVTDAMAWSPAYSRSAVYSMGLTLLVIFGILFAGQAFWPSWGRLGLGSLGIIIGYLLGIRVMAMAAQAEEPEAISAHTVFKDGAQHSLGHIVGRLCGSGLAVVVAGIWLTYVADGIADATGLGQTFVGSIFLALATSLPEMVVTISAVRMGVLAMAFGNIFGSNMANMFLISLCDLASPRGPILATVAPSHILTGAGSIVLTVITLAGIRTKPKTVRLGMGWDTWLILAVFLVVTGLLYYIR